MKSLVIGRGEVGKALVEILEPHYETYVKDLEEIELPERFDILHVCIRYSPDFLGVVRAYVDRFGPSIVNICSTVPPGTTERLGTNAVHSTTRGLHPNLVDGLRAHVKHIGGPKSDKVARYFAKAGIACHTHSRARTTELAHLLNNLSYGVNLMFADEMARICRQFGVDYYEAVMLYTETNNKGFERLDHRSKRRMILTPPGGHIGGHCIVQNAQILLPILEESGGNFPLVAAIAGYNGTSD